MSFAEQAAAILPELQALRRELHQNPEVGLDLPETQRRVLAAIDGLGLEITLGTKTTSITAVLRGGKTGRSVLLRGDMDGLPVTEQTGLPYASSNGNMHACGHDMHTAGLVGAARLLAAHRDELQGDVIFMFQPGEEGYNGASIMIEEGVLDAAGERPIGAYGIHVGPGPRGIASTRANTMAAGSSELHITVHGKGGHGSMPFSAIDPVPALAEIATQLQVMITRRLDSADPVVVTVTQLSAGEAINVIPPSATLGATVRTLSAESLAKLPGLFEEVAAGIAAAHGCTAEVVFQTQYIPTVNDPAETQFVFDALKDAFGEGAIFEMPNAMMGSEDFSFVLANVPGTFIGFGTTPEGVDFRTAAVNHSPVVVFDDEMLGHQAAILAELATRRLALAAQ